MGRPRVSDPRNRQLNLSLTTSEWERLAARAEAVGMRPVHFGRSLIVDEDDRRASHSRKPSNIERLNYLALARLGNNLNQMMRHLHFTGEPVPDDLKPLLSDIRKKLAECDQP